MCQTCRTNLCICEPFRIAWDFVNGALLTMGVLAVLVVLGSIVASAF